MVDLTKYKDVFNPARPYKSCNPLLEGLRRPLPDRLCAGASEAPRGMRMPYSHADDARRRFLTDTGYLNFFCTKLRKLLPVWLTMSHEVLFPYKDVWRVELEICSLDSSIPLEYRKEYVFVPGREYYGLKGIAVDVQCFCDKAVSKYGSGKLCSNGKYVCRE